MPRLLHYNNPAMLRSIIVIGLAVSTGTSGNAMFAQTKASKTTTTKKIAKPVSVPFLLTWNGKVYKLTSDKQLPLKELNEVFRSATSTATLKRQLADSMAESRRLQAASINTEELSADLKATKDELAETRRRVSILAQELEQTKNELAEIEDERDTIKDKFQEAKFLVSDLGFEVDRLKRAIDGFTFLDWKMVVPDVVSRFRSLKNDYFTLELKMTELP